MQVALYEVPLGDAGAQEALNRFLRSHRVLRLERQLVNHGGGCFWAFCVEYLDGDAPCPPGANTKAANGKGKRRIDYQEILSEEDFAVFARLRTWRNEEGERAAIPPYAVFTNEQLRQMAESRPDTKARLQAIEGIGEAKVSKYADTVLTLIPAREVVEAT